jgi:AAA15 family ATPase/GTPase
MGTLNKEESPSRATGYRMIEFAEIKNFRCFGHAELSECSRVNVIVGRNASGKTALLEALFLAAGPSPEVALRLKAWRGYEAAMASGTFAQIDEAVWGDIFFGYDRTRTVEVQLKGSDNHTRGVGVTYGEVEEVSQISTNRPAVSLSAATFTWTRFDGKKVEVRPEFTRGGYIFPGAETKSIPAMFFASSHPFMNNDNIQRFSELSKRRQDGSFIQAVKKEFPFISNIDVQSYVGQPMLHADIPGLPEKVPLVSVSSGVNKLTSILLALSMAENNIVFIDEIENGLHYSRLESTWRAMFQLAEKNGAQVFASTHSEECLRALATVFEKNPHGMTLIRTEADGSTSDVEQFHGETAVRSIKAGEVR